MSPPTDNRPEEFQARLAARDQLQRQLIEAQEALDREAYRLDTTDICLDLAEEEIRKLESLTMAGVMASLLGTKASQLDARRTECEALQREHAECAQMVETLTQQVADIREQLSAFDGIEREPQSPSQNAAGVEESEPSAESATALQNIDERERLERIIECGESLLSQLNGMYGLCSRLRNGPKMLGHSGVILAAVAHTSGRMAASSVAGHITDSVRHFCDQIEQLGLTPEGDPDADILAAIAQLRSFADSGSALDNKTEPWVELEVLCRSIVSDLHEKMAHGG